MTLLRQSLQAAAAVLALKRIQFAAVARKRLGGGVEGRGSWQSPFVGKSWATGEVRQTGSRGIAACDGLLGTPAPCRQGRDLIPYKVCEQGPAKRVGALPALPSWGEERAGQAARLAMRCTCAPRGKVGGWLGQQVRQHQHLPATFVKCDGAYRLGPSFTRGSTHRPAQAVEASRAAAAPSAPRRPVVLAAAACRAATCRCIRRTCCSTDCASAAGV